MMDIKREALEAINKKKLYDLAKYYGLDVKWKMRKSQIIDAIVAYYEKIQLEDQKADEDQMPPMSVRVRKIYRRNKGKLL
jgi:phosphate-selective porin